jgi:hypothetical protein
MKKEPTILVVHPDQYTTQELAAVLQDFGLNSLPLTNAADAIKHVENLDFDVAIVSIEMPSALPQLLFDSLREDWMEILLWDSTVGWDVPEFVQTVRVAASDRGWMRYLIAEACCSAWCGEAGKSLYRDCTQAQNDYLDSKIEEVGESVGNRKCPTQWREVESFWRLKERQ